MVKLKINPDEFLAEFPEFIKYLKRITHKKVHISETEIVDRTPILREIGSNKNVKRVRAEVRYGNVKKPLGELWLDYLLSKKGEELHAKCYSGAIPKIISEPYGPAGLTYVKLEPRFRRDVTKEWERLDGWLEVPFP